MTLANVDPGLVAALDSVGWQVVTGVGRWVLVELRGVAYAAAEAAGFRLEPVQGMAGVDFEVESNSAALAALVSHVARQKERMARCETVWEQRAPPKARFARH